MNDKASGELKEWLRDNLRIEIETTSEYVGINDGPMYKDFHTLRLVLDGETISEVSL